MDSMNVCGLMGMCGCSAGGGGVERRRVRRRENREECGAGRGNVWVGGTVGESARGRPWVGGGTDVDRRFWFIVAVEG